METRQCRKCGVTKPLDEFARSRGKYENRCKKCRTANGRAWALANAERAAAHSRAWYDRNVDQCKTARKASYEANGDTQREQMRAWKANNPVRRAELNRRFEQANPEKVRAYKKKYWKEHPDLWRDYVQQRRARQRNAPVVETIDRQRVIERDGSICWLCGEYCPPDEMSLDHVIPLSKGGEHTEANLRVAHGRCNSAKGARILT